MKGPHGSIATETIFFHDHGNLIRLVGEQTASPGRSRPDKGQAVDLYYVVGGERWSWPRIEFRLSLTMLLVPSKWREVIAG